MIPFEVKMKYPRAIALESITDDLRGDMADQNYSVYFDPVHQKYRVFYQYPHRLAELTDFNNWVDKYPLILDVLRKTKWESINGFDGLEDKEFYEKMAEQRELIDAAHIRNDVEPWAREVGHDLYHSTGKRVW